jgi:hypothetical protein
MQSSRRIGGLAFFPAMTVCYSDAASLFGNAARLTFSE